MKRLILATMLFCLIPVMANAYSLALNWDANPPAQNVTSYQVKMDGALKTTVTTNQATISGLTGAHSFNIIAVNKDGLISPPSNTISYSGEPSAATGLKITVTVDIVVP